MEVPLGNGRFERPLAFQRTGTVSLPLPGTSIGPRGSGGTGAVFGVVALRNLATLFLRQNTSPRFPPGRWCMIATIQSRGAGARLSGKREIPKGDRPAFREVARRIPPTSPSGRHPRERGRPARMLSLRLPLSFPAMLQPTALPAGTAWARPKQRQGAAAG